MKTQRNTPPAFADSPCSAAFGIQSEDEQIAQIIKLFDLDPVSKTADVLRITGDSRTRYFDRTSPNSEGFDPTYPNPIEPRSLSRAARRYWTIDILRWRIRQTTLASR